MARPCQCPDDPGADGRVGLEMMEGRAILGQVRIWCLLRGHDDGPRCNTNLEIEGALRTYLLALLLFIWSIHLPRCILEKIQTVIRIVAYSCWSMSMHSFFSPGRAKWSNSRTSQGGVRIKM
jgi:hypothetical protein